jgi:DNA-binding transcriptional ArsR family regulator
MSVSEPQQSLVHTCYRFFSTLANPTRLAILECLRERPRNVMQIAAHLGQEQSMISHNLRPLVQCRLVFIEKKWKERVYSVNRETMEPLFKLFNYHAQKYCPGKGACRADWRKRRDTTPVYIKRR